MPENRTSDAAAVLRRAQPGVKRFTPGLFFALCSALSAVALIACSGWLITRASEQPQIAYLSAAVVGVRAFALGRAAFRYVDRLFSHDAAFRQLAELRGAVFERLIPLAPAGLARTKRGDLLSRLVSDVDELQDLPLRVVQPLLVSAIVAVLSVFGVWLVLPEAALTLALCLVLAFVAGTVLHAAVAARAERRLAPGRGALMERILELVGSLDVLTAFGAVDERIDDLRRADAALRRDGVKAAFGAGLAASAMTLAAGLATLLAILVGAPALEGPQLTIIALVPLAVFEVCGMVPLAVGAWRQVRSSAGRVARVAPAQVPAGIPLDTAEQAEPQTEARAGEQATTRSAAPAIAFAGLSAHWPVFAGDGDTGAAASGTPTALSDLTMTIDAGERVLVRGESGAGKTTLANVLVRFIDYDGSFTLGGREARSMAPSELRRTVGLCEQQPWIFDSSLRQNLLFARETSSDAELLAVVERVGLGDWAASRGGLDAELGERGALVSGGQAQRIALARALLADFAVLVVDEPTANVDAAQAAALMRDILAATATGPDSVPRTVILISHDTVPGELIDRELVLQDGRLAVG
ncbi:ATP-binding cassette subfamily C protein CydC [Microterricola gilva]|uniref:ATP-binding cassette subfamily C protein CydC n=1 Tax=Microterricola gilva TaxID=393267 RepID=A0A4Q8ANA7_9MICO|nr:thiol reductant ABC exporter subunit CydC [Microterricola gilva]RZU65455.1 ATP-binding cassette subfamily C protein CydC [Microterricola gilva]